MNARHFYPLALLALTTIPHAHAQEEIPAPAHAAEAALPAPETTETVTAIHDGDTVTLATGERLRLEGIDAPELPQPHGLAAQAALADLVATAPAITVNRRGRDRYGRTIATIYAPIPDRRRINIPATMVQRGHAWHYPAYPGRYDYAARQTAAQTARRGLWASTDPVAPWDWRRRPRLLPSPQRARMNSTCPNGLCPLNP